MKWMASAAPASTSDSAATTEQDTCWICLDISSEGHKLLKPCACPRYVHSTCLGRWQLQSAGSREERLCRFCQEEYPSWVSSLTPPHLQTVTAQVQPWMAVVCGDKTVKVPVRPGPEGLTEFRKRVKELFGFPPECDFEVTFECRAPLGGEQLRLNGIQCYDAATHCAAISAAKRAVGDEEPGFAFRESSTDGR